MTAIKSLAETAESVTLSRADFEALVEAAEAAKKRAALRAQDLRVAREGKEAARADFLPAALTRRLIEGESPVRVWREHRGLPQRTLAERAGISASYLNQIERGGKPGSLAAMLRIARALDVRVEDLVATD